jgi:hypothetical protein
MLQKERHIASKIGLIRAKNGIWENFWGFLGF